MIRKETSTSETGFSLLFIIFILFGLVVASTFLILFLNPLERARETRDKKRFDDLVLLDRAIRFYLRNNADDPRLCNECVLGKNIFANKEIRIGTEEVLVIASTAVSGTGWVPLDFSLNAGLNKTPLLTLPLDPKNVDPFVYTYTPGPSGHFKLTTAFESQAYLEKAANDGGTLSDRFEIGIDLNLPPN